ncbi:MAG: hypothetical protein K6F33_14235, partial [Bacteroidales bacterium]|nr:hypothetical protein [Bacteroidales bacterium]
SFEVEPLTDTKVWTMRFEIVDVYKGDKWDDTAISEIYFDGLDVLCFAPGTKVMLADGSSKNIEDIREGDQVMSYNANTHAQEPATVEQTASTMHSKLVTYELADGNTITATDDHPLLTERGWASVNPTKSANYEGFESIAKIQVGDKLITASGVATIKSMTVSPESQTTYTITRLSNGNTFYANGVIAGVEYIKVLSASINE